MDKNAITTLLAILKTTEDDLPEAWICTGITAEEHELTEWESCYLLYRTVLEQVIRPHGVVLDVTHPDNHKKTKEIENHKKNKEHDRRLLYIMLYYLHAAAIKMIFFYFNIFNF